MSGYDRDGGPDFGPIITTGVSPDLATLAKNYENAQNFVNNKSQILYKPSNNPDAGSLYHGEIAVTFRPEVAAERGISQSGFGNVDEYKRTCVFTSADGATLTGIDEDITIIPDFNNSADKIRRETFLKGVIGHSVINVQYINRDGKEKTPLQAGSQVYAQAIQKFSGFYDTELYEPPCLYDDLMLWLPPTTGPNRDITDGKQRVLFTLRPFRPEQICDQMAMCIQSYATLLNPTKPLPTGVSIYELVHREELGNRSVVISEDARMGSIMMMGIIGSMLALGKAVEDVKSSGGADPMFGIKSGENINENGYKAIGLALEYMNGRRSPGVTDAYESNLVSNVLRNLTQSVSEVVNTRKRIIGKNMGLLSNGNEITGSSKIAMDVFYMFAGANC
jgi:hypothetical protein